MTTSGPDDRARRLLREAACHAPDQRTQFIEDACADDEVLLASVRSLIEAEEAHLAEGATVHVTGGILPSDTRIREPSSPGGAKTPAQIGRYRIVRKLGEGGMGTVYEARQQNPSRSVAIKVIATRFHSEAMRNRFRYETQILGRLQHPGIAQIYEAQDSDSEGDSPFFAMELVEGRPVTDYATALGLNQSQRLQLVAQICDAIHHAHQKGIVHRDLKPANILITDSGTPKILDFGVARALEESPDGVINTLTGQVLGTVAYMSPEQASAGEIDVDARSDIYSIGVILFEMLAGKLPHPDQKMSLIHSLASIREHEPQRLGTLNPESRGDVETIVGKALQKDREQRYASAAELAEDIRRFLRDEPILARPPSTAYQLKKFAKRNRALVASVAAIAVLMILSTIISTGLWLRASASEKRERNELIRAVASERAAQQELMRANELAKLMRNMFLAARPTGKDMKDYTVRQLLEDFSEKRWPELQDQPEVEVSLRATIAESQFTLGNYDEAARQAMLGMELAREKLGDRHRMTLLCMSSYAIACREKRQYDLSEKYQTLAAEGLKATLGPNHEDTIFAKSRLANLYAHQERYDEARAILRELIDVTQELHGPNDRRTLSTRSYYASVFFREGRFAEVEPLYADLVADKRRLLGSDHPHYLLALNNLAITLINLGRPEEALPLLQETLATRREVLDDTHPDTLNAVIDLGRLYFELGRFAEAIPYLQEFHDTPSRFRNERTEYFQECRYMLAYSLLSVGEYAQAEPLLKQCYEFFLARKGPRDGVTASVREALAVVYRSTDRPEMAQALEPIPPETPVLESPIGMIPNRSAIALKAGAFRHRLDAVQHRMTQWQIRAAEGSFDESPVLSVVSTEHLRELPLPAGWLPAGKSYAWRVRYVGSEGLASAYSEERSFTLDGQAPELVRIDLSTYFNRDVIANPGDAANDFFDDDARGNLVVAGFDGQRSDNSNVRGLPLDGQVGIHQLGDYSSANAIQLSQQDVTPLEIAVGHGALSGLRFLVSCGNGDCTIPIELRYDDGSIERKFLSGYDWFHSNVAFDPEMTCTPCWDGMDRLDGERFDDANTTALFEMGTSLPGARSLTKIVLRSDLAKFDNDRTRFHLFAVTGTR